MTLTAAELTRLRTDLAATLRDAGDVVRVASPAGFDPADGTYDAAAETEIYSGAARVQPLAGSERVVRFGEEPVTIREYHVTLPHDAAGIEVDDIWVTTTSDDTDLVGRRMRVIDVTYSSIEAVRRLRCLDDLG